MVFETSFLSIYIPLIIIRFLLGIGIGGEYPLSAAITAESSESTTRGRALAAVFSMQGFGAVAAAFVAFILILGFSNENSRSDLNWIWRLSLGFGAIPGLLGFYFRLTMEETTHFLKLQNKPRVNHWKLLKMYSWALVGTCGTWFLLDVVFYANSIFSGTVLAKFFSNVNGAHAPLLNVAKFNLLISGIALPGYWCAVLLIEWKLLARKRLQLLGFLFLGITYLFIGFFEGKIEDSESPFWIFTILYGVTFFLSNCGPNTTTYVLPSEIYPTEVRSLYHGLSAAAGKVGALVGTAAMAPLLSEWGVGVVMMVCGGVSLVGALVTLVFIQETRGKSLEQLASESEIHGKKDQAEEETGS